MKIHVTVTQSLDPRMDYAAYDEDTYDCDWDSERGFFSTCPVGYGRTAREAVADFIELIEDDDERAAAQLQEDAINAKPR